MVADTMRTYGATTVGVLANVSAARAGRRAILGFTAYGMAPALYLQAGIINILFNAHRGRLLGVIFVRPQIPFEEHPCPVPRIDLFRGVHTLQGL